jgi:hypothetical protein
MPAAKTAEIGRTVAIAVPPAEFQQIGTVRRNSH